MKKGSAGMLSLEFDGTDYLFMVGGTGTTPAVKHPQFQYEQLKDGNICTNEQLLYNLSKGEFYFYSHSHVMNNLKLYPVPFYSLTSQCIQKLQERLF